MTTSRRTEQTRLGLSLPPKPLTPFQRELLARAGTILSPGQQMTARRRADREEREHQERKREEAGRDARRTPGLHQLRVR
jgi:hypothetical protein